MHRAASSACLESTQLRGPASYGSSHTLLAGTLPNWRAAQVPQDGQTCAGTRVISVALIQRPGRVHTRSRQTAHGRTCPHACM